MKATMQMSVVKKKKNFGIVLKASSAEILGISNKLRAQSKISENYFRMNYCYSYYVSAKCNKTLSIIEHDDIQIR